MTLIKRLERETTRIDERFLGLVMSRDVLEYDFDILISPALKLKSDGFNANNSPNRAPVSIANKINR